MEEVRLVELNEARVVYAHPNGRTKKELAECLQTLNETAQPIELNNIQFAAVVDAHQRLNLTRVVATLTNLLKLVSRVT